MKNHINVYKSSNPLKQMETNKEILKNITYKFIEPKELRQAQIPAEHISAAIIGVKSKYLDSDYGLFYHNYKDKFDLTVADGEGVLFLSRPFVCRRIEDIVEKKVNKGTNVISLEKAMDSEDIARFTEECKRYFKKVEIEELYLWEIEEGKLPGEKISAGYHKHWFLEEYAPTK